MSCGASPGFRKFSRLLQNCIMTLFGLLQIRRDGDFLENCFGALLEDWKRRKRYRQSRWDDEDDKPRWSQPVPGTNLNVLIYIIVKIKITITIDSVNFPISFNL